jgi:TPR repeat protein
MTSVEAIPREERVMKGILFIALLFLVFAGPAAQAGTFEKVSQKTSEIYNKALAGDPRAQFTPATLYEKGQGGFKKDIAYALSWYEEAARNGFKMAVFRLHTLERN